MSIFERKKNVEYFTPEVQSPFDFGEQYDIFKKQEEHFTTYSEIEIETQAHKNRIEALTELELNLPEGYLDPYETKPQQIIDAMGGMKVLGRQYAGNFPLMYEDFKKQNLNLIDSLVLNERIKQPQNKKLLDISATKEERKLEQKNVVLNNNLLAAQVSDDPNYNFTANLLGAGAAQIKDPVTIGSLLIPGVSYAKLGATFLQRMAGFSMANATLNTVAEIIQSDHAKKMIKDLNININNEQINSELKMLGINIDPGISEEDLEYRLAAAFIGGFILSPVIGLPLELLNKKTFQLQKIMDGNKKTLNEIDDAITDANTDIFNQPLHVQVNMSNRMFKDKYMADELPKDLSIKHTIKIAEKTQELAFAKTVKKNWSAVDEIKEIDKSIELLEKNLIKTKNNVMLEDFELNLPNNLKNAKPRFNKQNIDFESEIDKALYIVRNRKKLSKYDNDYINFLQKRYPKKDIQQIRKMGDKVLKTVKTVSKGSPNDDIFIKPVYKSKDTVIRQEERKITKNAKFNKADRAVLKELMQQKNFMQESHNNNFKLLDIEFDPTQKKYVIKTGFEKELKSPNLFKNINTNYNKSINLIKEAGFSGKFINDFLKNYNKKLLNIKAYQKELQQKLAKGDPEEGRTVIKKLMQLDADFTNLTQLLEHKKNVTSADYSFAEISTDLLAKDYAKNKIVTNNLEDVIDMTRLQLLKLIDDETYRGMNVNSKNFILKHEEDFVRQMVDNVPSKNKISNTLANNFRTSFNYARQLANKYGDDIAYFDNFFPQSHNRNKIVAEFGNTSEKWVAYVKSKLDLEQTAIRYEVDVSKHGWENILDERLTDTWKRILTGDIFKSLATPQSGQSFLKNNHSRYLIFKDGQSFLDYQKLAGNPSLKAGIDYINHMSTHIGLLRKFGPRYHEGANLVNDFARAADADKNLKPKLLGTKFENIHDYVVGHENIPVTFKLFTNRLTGKEVNLADFSKETRGLLQGSQLGGASIMAVADQVFAAVTRMINGMPISTQFNSFFKTLSADKGYMAKAGVSLEYLTNDIYNNSRLLGETMDDGFFAKTSQKVLKYSGLIDMTEMSQNGFKYDFQMHITRLAETEWSKISNTSKNMLDVYGITKEDLNVLRNMERIKSPNGNDGFVRVIDIPDETVQQKFITYMNAENDIGTPTKTARARAFMMGGSRRGTGSGELARSFWLYKNFPMSIMFTHLARTLMLKRTHGLHAGAAYFGTMITMSSVIGAMLYNVKRVAAGKDPEPWSIRTLGLGAMYGGGMSIFGDVMLHDGTMYGRSFLTSFAGPVVGLVDDVHKLFNAPFSDFLYTDKDNIASKLPTRMVDFVNRYTPFTNLWYIKLAKERLIVDQIKEAIDPNFYSKARREQTREMKYGSGIWWQRGSMYPGEIDLGKFLELKD